MLNKKALYALRFFELAVLSATMFFALPIAYSTYQCSFNGTLCQYSMIRPSQDATISNVQRFSEIVLSDAAEFQFEEFARAENESVELSVFDGEDQYAIFSETSDNVTGKAISDDRRIAIVLIGQNHDPQFHIFWLGVSEKFITRQYRLKCWSENQDNFISIANPDYAGLERILSFDIISSCRRPDTKFFPDHVFYFGSSFDINGRVYLQFDENMNLVGVYPNGTWDQVPSGEEISERERWFDLIQEQGVLSASIRSACVDTVRESVLENPGRRLIRLCETPDQLAGEPTYWKTSRRSTIVAGSSLETFSIRETDCDADDFERIYVQDERFFETCKFRISFSGQVSSSVIFTLVDDKNDIIELAVNCKCSELILDNVDVGEGLISFDVASSVPQLEFDGNEVILGGRDSDYKFAPATYRGRVTATFFPGGWLDEVRFTYPDN